MLDMKSIRVFYTQDVYQRNIDEETFVKNFMNLCKWQGNDKKKYFLRSIQRLQQYNSRIGE